MGIIQRKKRILLNEPHIETTSGSIALFNTDMRAKLKECKVEFLPVQSGSGDPSPTNIRPIGGWDGVILHHSGATSSEIESLPITFPSTQYRGYVDLVTGELWKTYNYLHFIPSYIQAVTEGIYSPYYAVSAKIGNAKNQGERLLSDKLVGSFTPNEFEAFISSEPRLIVGLPSTLNTLSAVRSWMEDIGGFDIVYKLATPQLVTTLSPTAITTLIGTNNIWSNANGDVSVKYWTH